MFFMVQKVKLLLFEIAKFQFILFEVLILHKIESVPFALFLQIYVQFAELGNNYNYLFFLCVFRLQKFLSMPVEVLKVSKIYSATQGRNCFQDFFLLFLQYFGIAASYEHDFVTVVKLYTWKTF